MKKEVISVTKKKKGAEVRPEEAAAEEAAVKETAIKVELGKVTAEAKAEMPKKPEKLAVGELLENKVAVWKDWDYVYNEKFFGKIIKEEKTEYLQLSMEEAMLLLERELIEIKVGSKKIAPTEFYSKCCTLDNEFPQKFSVYRDLRNRGFIVKSGFKFGTHFRVYERGVNPYKEGPKGAAEHTKYNVHAYSEAVAFSPAELSRFVRLSQNIRAIALLAIVDVEGEPTYYRLQRIKP